MDIRKSIDQKLNKFAKMKKSEIEYRLNLVNDDLKFYSFCMVLTIFFMLILAAVCFYFETNTNFEPTEKAMGLWDNIKITANGKDENNIIPDWKQERFPDGKNTLIIESPELFDSTVSDLINRLFAREDIEMTPKVLKDISRIESADYPEQFLLVYKQNILGLVYVSWDMFDTFITFDSQYKTFQIL